ncbi:uncharacterized protein LY79DRAFT_412735 [Colletotrichum navitas]|uniref:Uncharacterized protein n=1 Tax=Colletotrichum navitas TaxID=681940 RepID=A0AAD8PPH3_9PEZI|nr:uncharacterized protein LY79DRAFT_412735 [Colletotrichum navitas]KAK1573365.1 hypothetical protein LY79DRAFT_412735 [Colletotrichum navitas]
MRFALSAFLTPPRPRSNWRSLFLTGSGIEILFSVWHSVTRKGVGVPTDWFFQPRFAHPCIARLRLFYCSPSSSLGRRDLFLLLFSTTLRTCGRHDFSRYLWAPVTFEHNCTYPFRFSMHIRGYKVRLLFSWLLVLIAYTHEQHGHRETAGFAGRRW